MRSSSCVYDKNTNSTVIRDLVRYNVENNVTKYGTVAIQEPRSTIRYYTIIVAWCNKVLVMTISIYVTYKDTSIYGKI